MSFWSIAAAAALAWMAYRAVAATIRANRRINQQIAAVFGDRP